MTSNANVMADEDGDYVLSGKPKNDTSQMAQ